MQLLFSSREQNLLAVALGYPWADPHRRQICSELLARVLAHDFGFGYDELEDLSEILLDARTCEELVEDQKEIQSIIDKLTEAMAMA